MNENRQKQNLDGADVVEQQLPPHRGDLMIDHVEWMRKNWDWKKAYHEPIGKPIVALMAVATTFGLYSLYEKFQSVPHSIHPAAKLGGLAVAVAGAIGLCEVLAGKEPSKPDQQPHETLDSWKEKINAQRAKEKELASELVR
jgi:hypothetical protein